VVPVRRDLTPLHLDRDDVQIAVADVADIVRDQRR
jgi:hypothetical protein